MDIHLLRLPQGSQGLMLATRKSGADAWSENARDFERKRIKK